MGASPIASTTLIRESPIAYWYEVTLTNGRTFTMTVPKES